MPLVSKFYGIIVFMNYNEHNPPHFRAIYQEQEVSIDIQSGIVQGKMSKRALRMLFEWSEMHKEELMENWELARNRIRLVFNNGLIKDVDLKNELCFSCFLLEDYL